MAKAIHTMIRVFDLDLSISFYKQALNLKVAERLSFDDFSLVYLRNDESDFELELTHNHYQSERYTHGTGYGHLAVSVEDIQNTRSNLLNNSLEPTEIKKFHKENHLLARFFFLVDPDGYKIEFIERHGRFK
ncbi:MAG: VOC family protein [Pseudomonadales bacterium]